MADLTDLQAAQTVKIVGTTSSGVETNAVNADLNGNLQVVDYADGPVTPGTVAAMSNLVGGQFNTSLPTLTSTQQAALQVDSNGRIIISADKNYGTVGANTIRTASQIGNATGAADFGAGASTAQTLRVTSSNFPTTLDTNYGTAGANTLRTASQIGNATGAADFNSGATGAQTLRTSSNLSDGAGTKLTSTLLSGKQSLDVNIANDTFQIETGIVDESSFTYGTSIEQPIGGVYQDTSPQLTAGQTGAVRLTQHRAFHTNLRNAVGVELELNYGTTSAATLRAAAQIGNSTGQADFNAGATGAQTLRTIANQGATGSTAWLTTDAADGPVTPGTVASKSILTGGQFNTTLPTLTSAQQSSMQLDSHGRLITSPPAFNFFHPIYAGKIQTAGAGTAGATVASLAVTIAATKAGSLLVVTAASQAQTLTITDSAAQTYSTATSQTSGTSHLYTFYVSNSAAGVTSVTITPGANDRMTIIVTEYANIDAASSLDKTSTNSQAAVTSWTSNSTATTTVATELLIGSALDPGHNNNTFTAGSGWAVTTAQSNSGGGSLLSSFQEDQFVTATGAYAATGTNTTSATIVSAIATFKITTPPSGFTIVNKATTIDSTPGSLNKVTVNTAGTGGASVTFYDSLTNSGTIIAVLSLLTVGTYEYEVKYATGLTMVVNSSTADFTVVYD